MSGISFEDRLADALDNTVGDDGVALLRKQSMSMRRGSFQMSQEADVLLDSKDRAFYAAFECKSRDYQTSRERGLTGLYFSGDYSDEQIEKQAHYRDLSGRRFFVGVELREFRDAGTACYLVPFSVFEIEAANGNTKVTWEKIAYLGRYVGDTTLEVGLDDLDYVESVGNAYEKDPEGVSAWVDEVDDGETLPVEVEYPVE